MTSSSGGKRLTRNCENLDVIEDLVTSRETVLRTRSQVRAKVDTLNIDNNVDQQDRPLEVEQPRFARLKTDTLD